MIGEANFYGLYIPWLGLLALAALLGLWGVRRSRRVPLGVAPGAVRPCVVRPAALRLERVQRPFLKNE